MEKKRLNRPRMIFFDYGGTILYEPHFSSLNGVKEICKYITANPLGLTMEQINARVKECFDQMAEFKRMGAEVHQWQFMRLVYESMGLEFSLSYEELEQREWNAVSPGAVVPYADDMLQYLFQNGIRTGVISNLGWSGKALTERINRLLPDNHFEHIIASSEYGVRKPNPLLFEVALKKAKLSANEVWFCGDTPAADVMGAYSAGMFPVLYRGEPLTEVIRSVPVNIPSDVEYLTINDWRELIETIENM